MKHTLTDSQGSLIAWGTGFSYHYDASKKMLNIEDLPHQESFAQIHIQDMADDHTAVMSYIETLDKTNQIKALMYSGNASINLVETLDRERISAILDNTRKITGYVQDLLNERYERFADTFSHDFHLRAIKLKRYLPQKNSGEFFIGRIHTQSNNAVCARGCSMVTLLAAMSDRTLRDLITMEFGNRLENSAQNLLNASSKLSTISRVMDEHFIPSRRLKAPVSAAKLREGSGDSFRTR